MVDEIWDDVITDLDSDYAAYAYILSLPSESASASQPPGGLCHGECYLRKTNPEND
ncbi:hypothetical protein OHA91_39305 (plasmid) [Streptomyces erythrochromogenes]|uniref:Uncharacterized protein n=1 Tax=Streptomyces erythrochromogenes TaxID=285574 RepID=A0ABZ1QPF7_9ACTN|nr:hypothetical protein [Streptomyces erythrochromogenes]